MFVYVLSSVLILGGDVQNAPDIAVFATKEECESASKMAADMTKKSHPRVIIKSLCEKRAVEKAPRV